jgi:hypothetical protein
VPRTFFGINHPNGERRDVVGAEPEVEHTASDGVIASATGGATMERGHKTPHVLLP